MNWQLVIGLILLTPIAVPTVIGYVKWTLYVWKVRTNRNAVNMVGTGREHWTIWLILHTALSTLIGTCLLITALEGEQQ